MPAVTYDLTGSVSEDLANAGNYTPSGGPPTTGDTLRIGVAVSPSRAVSLSPNQFNLATGMTVLFGPLMRYAFGGASNPIAFGTGTVVRYSAPNLPSCYLDVESATKMNVRETSTQLDSLVLIAGTYVLNVASGRVKVSSGVTISVGRIIHRGSSMTDPVITLKSGCVVTSWRQKGGHTIAEMTPSSVYVDAGTFLHAHASSATMALLEMHDRGLFLMRGVATIFMKIDGFGGTVDGRECPAATITNADSWVGNVLDLNNGQDTIVTTNPINVYGGTVRGGSQVNTTEEFDAA